VHAFTAKLVGLKRPTYFGMDLEHAADALIDCTPHDALCSASHRSSATRAAVLPGVKFDFGGLRLAIVRNFVGTDSLEVLNTPRSRTD
jgi:hypothetical protein